MTRPARSRARVLADVLRGVGLASVGAAVLFFDGIAVALFALVLLGLLLPRFLALPAPLDVFSGVAVLVAGWSAVLDLYEALAWWDLVVHAACTAPLTLVVAAGVDRLVGARTAPGTPRWRVVALAALWTGSLGLTLGALWEVGEWAGHTYLDPTINVGYEDTLSDMLVGGLGAAVAGALVAARASANGGNQWREESRPMSRRLDGADRSW